MKIGLIDIDSKIPNLALMKLSTHHKQRGHQVDLTSPLFANQYDQCFASKVFDYTEMPILPSETFVWRFGNKHKNRARGRNRTFNARLFSLSRHGLFIRFYN